MTARISRFAAVLCMSLSTAIASAEPKRTEAKVPDEREQALLIYRTMAALDTAHATGNYTVLRDIAAPQFAAVNDAARLSEIFSVHRKMQLDLGPVLLHQPLLNKPAHVDSNGFLSFNGYFDTKPVLINFDLTYQWTAAGWRVFAINVQPTRHAAS